MRAAFWLVASAVILTGTLALAQDDDWSLARPDHHPARAHGPRGRHAHAPSAPASRLLDRYRAMVMRDPSETFALARWVTLATERDGSTDPLTTEMRAAAASDASAIVPRMVLAYVARRAGRADEARALYGEIISAHPDDPIGEAELARTEREAGALPAARVAYERARAHARAPASDVLAHEELDVLVLLGDVEAAGALDAQLAGAHASVERGLELPRAWLAHQHAEAALAALDAIELRVAGDPRALVPVRLERARAEIALGATSEALRSLDVVLRAARGGLRVETYELAYEAHRQANTLDVLAAQLGHEHALEALALLARLEDERGHDDAALAAYDHAIRARPRDAGLRERRAHVLLRMGRVDEAASALESLWRATPDEPDRLVEAASLLVETGRHDDAIALLTSASAARPRDVRLHQRLAEVFARWDDETRALAEAQTLVRLEPSDPEHHALVGDLLLARGDRTGALAAFHQMIALDDTAAGHDRLGMTLADHDLLDDARAELGEALRLAPDDRATIGHLAEVLVRAGRDADAEPLATRLVVLSAGDPLLEREARAGLVSIWARRRTLDRHIEALATRFAASPPDLDAGALLAEALRRSGALARAEDVLVRLSTLAPDDVEGWTTLERVRALRGDLAGAIEALDQAARVDPPRAAGYLARMSEDALALYRDDDAIRYAERALALAPDDAHGHVRLGDLHRRRRESEAAMASYRRALALDADLHDVALTLAELTRESGDPEAADALYARVIAESPDDDLVSRAIDASLEIELARGSAEPLLDRLLTLALASYDRPILARAALAVIDVIIGPLLPRAEGDDEGARAARADVHRIASRGLGVLLRALASSDPSEQRTALTILSTARIEAAAPALLAASETHGEGALGLDALLAAARVATPSLVPRLASIAQGSDAQRARVATWGLARVGGTEATRALELLAATDSDVAALAALGLVHEGGSGEVAILSRSLAHQAGTARRAAFVVALAGLEHPPSAADCTALADAGGSSRAVAMLTCGNAALVAHALLGSLDASSAMRAARHAATDLRTAWPEPGAGETPVALALRAIDLAPRRAPTDALAQALARAARDGLESPTPGPTLRALAAREGHLALSAFEGTVSAPLFEATSDALITALPAAASDAEVRTAVARLLAALRANDPRLEALLGDASRDVVRAALEGLGARPAIAPGLAVPLAAILGGSADWVSRLGAARALARVPEGGEAALVSALASDAFAFVREAAAQALGARTGEVGLSALRTAADADPEEQVRAAATAALERRGVALR